MLVVLFFLFPAAVAFYYYFHRIPGRISPRDSGSIVSPADGVIWQIVRLEEEQCIAVPKPYLGKIQTLCSDIENAAYVVSIFMNPLDVHVNWSPVEGNIVSIKHTEGNFSFANTWKSWLNEKNEVLIQTPKGHKIKVIQIAGFFARRIQCWVKEGMRVAKGEKIGMIRLGSQVSMILPKPIALQVKAGQRVRGGETIIGMFE